MPLRYVDPHRRRGPGYHRAVQFGRSRIGQFVARHIARRTDPVLFRLTGGRVNISPIVNAPLRTVGAKSGKPREVQLTYFHDGADVILIASNFGGSSHPQWYYNLSAHPECEFGQEPFTAHRVTDARTPPPLRTGRAGVCRICRLPREDRRFRTADPDLPVDAARMTDAVLRDRYSAVISCSWRPSWPG